LAGNARDILIRLLGDSSGMKKALDDADGAVGKHDLSLKNLAGTIGSAYAAGKVLDYSKASIEAAAADEASQVKLATALQNTTGATDAQIASAEAWITKTMFATNVADDELRPALSRLVTATGDVKEAQDLMGVAIDLSVGKGISLQAASEALAKAQDGNTTALRKMGIETKDAEGKTLSFTEIVKNLADVHGGQAAKAADTQAGKLANMKLRYGELQEQVGSALMPIMEELVGVLSGVAEWFTSLDEGTQQWIIRIGMLGGGLVLATRAVSGVLGPLKSLGVIGGATTKVMGEGANGAGRFSGALGKLGPALGIAGGFAAAGLAIYQVLSSEKATLRQVTDDFATSLQAEAAGQNGATVAAIAAQLAQSDALAVGEKMGISASDIAKIIKGESVPAWDALNARIAESSFQNRGHEQKTAELKKTYGITGAQVFYFREEITRLAGAMEIAQTETANTDAVNKAFGIGVEGSTAKVVAAGSSTKHWTDIVSGATTKLQENKVGVDTSAGSVSYWTDIVSGATDKTNSMKTAVAQLDNEYRALTGNLDQREAWLNLLDTMDAYKWKMNSGELSTRQQEQATIDAKQAVLGMIGTLKDVPAETRARLVSQVERGQLDETVRDIERITSRTHTATIRVNLTGGTGIGGVKYQARGGVSDGGLTVLGEEGPELVNMKPGAMVYTAAQTRRMLSVPSGVAGVGGSAAPIINNYTFNGPVMGEQDFIRRLEEGRQDAIRRGALLVPA